MTMLVNAPQTLKVLLDVYNQGKCEHENWLYILILFVRKPPLTKIIQLELSASALS